MLIYIGGRRQLLQMFNASVSTQMLRNMVGLTKYVRTIPARLGATSPTIPQRLRRAHGGGIMSRNIDVRNRENLMYLKGVGLEAERMPKHILLTLDGTRRASHQMGKDLTYHQLFYTPLIMFAQLCIKLRIPAASFAVFATCTWKRSNEAVDLILRQFQETIENNLRLFIREGIKVSVIGQKWRFSKSLQSAIEKVEEATMNGENIHITYLMSYGGRWDMTEACKSISRLVLTGEIKPEDINEALVQQHISTGVVTKNLPKPDLLIRCGGKRRFSNFYVWQLAHAKLYFSDLLLSDFGETEFLDALRWFQWCE